MPTAYEIEVTLRNIRPRIWRRLRVPGAMTLGDLHAVLQIAFEWNGDHLHHFVVGKKIFEPFDDSEWDHRTHDEDSVRLEEIAKKGSKLTYEYDFGDSWRHDIVVTAVVEADGHEANQPICLAGARSAPPDDCGGTGGYADMLEVLSDPEHPEREDQLAWLGGSWDPELFDRDAINAELEDFEGGTDADDGENVEGDDLDRLLAEHSAFDSDALLGLLHAVVVAPGLVSPPVWMKLVFPRGLGAASVAEAEPLIGMVMTCYNHVVQTILEGNVVAPAADDVAGCRSFAVGYVAGASLDPLWTGSPARWTFAAPFAHLAGMDDLVIDEVRERVAKMRDPDATVRRELGGLIIAANESFAKVRRASIDAAREAKGPLRGARVGRNDACPCGSGKKFKRCCIDATDSR